MPPEISRRSLLTTGGRLLAAGVVGGLTLDGARRAVVPAASAAATQAGPLGRPLRIGHLPITDAAALLVAHERGHFATAGLPSARPTLFRTWESLAQAFVVGEVDVVHLLMPLALQMRFGANVPLRVLGWAHTNGSALTVARGVDTLADLAGRTVAVPQWWSIHNVLLQRTLAAEGLDVALPGRTAGARDVRLVVMPPAEMVSALSAGRIAGFAVAEPFGTVAARTAGGRTLRYLGDIWREHACCCVVVRDELLTMPGVGAAVARGLLAAQDEIDADRAAAAGILTSGHYLPQPPPAVNAVLTRERGDAVVTRHPTWDGERYGVQAYPRPGYTARLVDLLRHTRIDGATEFLGTLDPGAVHDRLVDASYIEAEMRRLGRSLPAAVTEEIDA